MRLESQYVTFY